MREQDQGVTPSGPGSRPSDGAASSGVSTVPASIPNAMNGPTPWPLVNALHILSRSFVQTIAQRVMQEAAEEICRLRAISREAYAEGWEDGWLGGTANPREDFSPDTVEEDWRRSDVRRALASGIEARRAETGTGSVHESPVAEGETPNAPKPDIRTPTKDTQL